MNKYTYSLLFACLMCTLGFGQGSLDSNSPYDNDNMLMLLSAIDALEEEHCEVPCGIYGDSLRISLIKEHVSTVEKAMNQINKLSAEEKPNYNQLVRWINNKEKHAEEIQSIVAQYFLHQRVKMPKKDLGKKEAAVAKTKYHNLLSSLHAMQVYAMKCKQGTDLNQVGNINGAIADFESYYFHGHKH